MSGLSQYVYLVYYDALGAIILLPWFLHRRLSKKTLPITFSLLCRFFGLSLIGRCMFPIFVYTGLNYTSVAISNLTLIFTFLIAICLRIEMLHLRKSNDQIKTFGTIVSVLGALVVTLYKGKACFASDYLPFEQSNRKWKVMSPMGNGLHIALFPGSLLSVFLSGRWRADAKITLQLVLGGIPQNSNHSTQLNDSNSK